MSRHNHRGRAGRRFDTRLSFGEISKVLGLSPKQRILLLRHYKEKMKNNKFAINQNNLVETGGEQDRF